MRDRANAYVHRGIAVLYCAPRSLVCRAAYASGERMFQVQFIDPAHQRQVDLTSLLRSIVGSRTRQRKNLALPYHRQIVGTIDRFFTLSIPALVSVPLKKSFSNASWPIFACRVLMSTRSLPARR